MSEDRRSKLLELASKRKIEESDEEEQIKSNTSKRNVKPKKYVESDDDDDDEEEDNDKSDFDFSEEEIKPKPKRVSKSEKKAPKKRAPKKKVAVKLPSSDNEASDVEKSDVSDTELQTLDTALIIPGGRRTRGKKIDYKQFGADPEDEDE